MLFLSLAAVAAPTAPGFLLPRFVILQLATSPERAQSASAGRRLTRQ
jgi:hypothetical protein